jgi:hypothetical protein
MQTHNDPAFVGTAAAAASPVHALGSRLMARSMSRSISVPFSDLLGQEIQVPCRVERQLGVGDRISPIYLAQGLLKFLAYA